MGYPPLPHMSQGEIPVQTTTLIQYHTPLFLRSIVATKPICHYKEKQSSMEQSKLLYWMYLNPSAWLFGYILP